MATPSPAGYTIDYVSTPIQAVGNAQNNLLDPIRHYFYYMNDVNWNKIDLVSKTLLESNATADDSPAGGSVLCVDTNGFIWYYRPDFSLPTHAAILKIDPTTFSTLDNFDISTVWSFATQTYAGHIITKGSCTQWPTQDGKMVVCCTWSNGTPANSKPAPFVGAFDIATLTNIGTYNITLPVGTPSNYFLHTPPNGNYYVDVRSSIQIIPILDELGNAYVLGKTIRQGTSVPVVYDWYIWKVNLTSAGVPMVLTPLPIELIPLTAPSPDSGNSPASSIILDIPNRIVYGMGTANLCAASLTSLTEIIPTTTIAANPFTYADGPASTYTPAVVVDGDGFLWGSNPLVPQLQKLDPTDFHVIRTWPLPDLGGPQTSAHELNVYVDDAGQSHILLWCSTYSGGEHIFVCLNAVSGDVEGQYAFVIPVGAPLDFFNMPNPVQSMPVCDAAGNVFFIFNNGSDATPFFYVYRINLNGGVDGITGQYSDVDVFTYVGTADPSGGIDRIGRGQYLMVEPTNNTLVVYTSGGMMHLLDAVTGGIIRTVSAPPWDSDVVYAIGDIVSYNGGNHICVTAGVDLIPEDGAGNWNSTFAVKQMFSLGNTNLGPGAIVHAFMGVVRGPILAPSIDNLVLMSFNPTTFVPYEPIDLYKSWEPNPLISDLTALADWKFDWVSNSFVVGFASSYPWGGSDYNIAVLPNTGSGFVGMSGTSWHFVGDVTVGLGKSMIYDAPSNSLLVQSTTNYLFAVNCATGLITDTVAGVFANGNLSVMGTAGKTQNSIFFTADGSGGGLLKDFVKTSDFTSEGLFVNTSGVDWGGIGAGYAYVYDPILNYIVVPTGDTYPVGGGS